MSQLLIKVLRGEESAHLYTRIHRLHILYLVKDRATQVPFGSTCTVQYIYYSKTPCFSCSCKFYSKKIYFIEIHITRTKKMYKTICDALQTSQRKDQIVEYIDQISPLLYLF